MNARPDIWEQTISGRAFPLATCGPDDIDLFGDVAQSLARICRYGGHVPGNPYSVAQHCVVMADAALDETGDAALAAHCLLHDAHEAYFGDMTTPVAHWLAALEVEVFGNSDPHGGVIQTLISTAKQRLDAVIWRAAAVAEPDRRMRAVIADYDIRMLAAERRMLLMRSPKSWGGAVENAAPLRLRGGLRAWPVAVAADAYRDRLGRLCPNARRV